MASDGPILRVRLAAGENLVGAFITAPSPELAEVAAYCGFDFAVIDAEHGAIDMGSMLHMIRAAASAGLPSIVRVPEASKPFVLRALDAGAAGIVVPQVETVEQARCAVAEARYPPVGRRGAAYYSRAHRYTGRSGFAAIDAGDAEVAVGIQIESPNGIDRLEEILDVSGIDFVLAGPADLAVAYGRGNETAARVDAAMAKLGDACRRRGLPAIIGAASPEAVASLRQLGFTSNVTGLLPLLMRSGETFVNGIRALDTTLE